MVATADLTIYERITDPMAAAKFMGEAIAKSGMFGVAGEKQGIVLALECMARRQPILTLTETYHLIHGRLSMKADKMLANFNEAGGKHRVISRNGDLATVELTSPAGDVQQFSLSWEDAKEEAFVYHGKESDVVAQLLGDRSKLKVKEKYSTPRARMQMLWARVISDGVRTMMPSANSGRYTPEEIDDDELPPGARSQVVGAQVETAEVATDENTVEGQIAEQADEPQTVEPTAADAPFEAPAAESPTKDKFSTAEQSQRLNDLYIALELTPEQIHKALKKRNAAANRGLMFDAAAELIATLENALANKQMSAGQVEQGAAEVAGESRQTSGNATTNPGGPATPEQVEQVRALCKELAQTSPAQFNRYLAHMKAAGLKAADLSAADCNVLLGDLHTKNLSAFFDLSLQKWQPAEGDSKN